MQRIYILFTFILATSILKAQPVPGYLGKRFSVSYKLHTFTSLANPTSAATLEPISSSGEQESKANFIFHGQHYLNFEYAVSKKHSLTADFLFTNLYFDPLDTYDSFIDSNGNYVRGASDNFGSGSAMGFLIGCKFYSNHYAPLGSYFQLKLGVVQITANDYTYSVYDEDELYNTSPPYQPVGNYTISGSSSISPVLSLSWGVNRIIVDKIIIDYGLEIGFAYKGWQNNSTLINPGNSSYISIANADDSYNQEQILSLAEGRYLTQNLINFRLGVGYLF